MVPSVYFCSVSTYQVLSCQYHLPLFAAECHASILSGEMNQPAKLPLDGDHIHAAFHPCIEPAPCFCDLVSFCPCVLLLPTSQSSNLLSIQSFSCPPVVEIPCILLDSGLWALLLSLFLMWQDSYGLVSYIYLLMCLWDVAYPGAFQQAVLLLEACDSLGPCIALLSKGL